MKQVLRLKALTKISSRLGAVAVTTGLVGIVTSLLIDPHLVPNYWITKAVGTTTIAHLAAMSHVLLYITAALTLASVMLVRTVSNILDRLLQQRDLVSSPRKSPRLQPGRKSSLVEGVASILDFGNTLAMSMPGLTARQKDYLALRSDWAAVGDDLQLAVSGFEEEINRQGKGAALGGGGRSA